MNISTHVFNIHARIVKSLKMVVHTFNNNLMNMESASDKS